MDKIRWGIIGPGSIAHNFADALKQLYSGELIAIASRTSNKLEEFGNKYYSDSKGKKRWVIYKKRVESTKIPPNWHSWIHFQTKNKPNLKRQLFSWQKQHEENLTGTKREHKPDGSMLNNEKKDMKKYETWKN